MIPERLPKSINGLKEMIKYIDSLSPTKDLTICEIGSWTGCSMVEFAKAFKKVICIDPFDSTGEINTLYNMKEVEAIFDKRASQFNNVIKIKGLSENVCFQIEDIDVLYIDGLHEYSGCKRDILLYKNKIKKIICGHDYSNKFKGVIKAVNEILGIPDKTFTDTSWLKVIK
jgi:precorrin-6B methylase 2